MKGKGGENKVRGKEDATRISRRLNLHLVTKEERTILVQARYSNRYTFKEK